MSLTILPQLNTPMDERLVCETYEKMISPATWMNTDSQNLAYVGMVTSVTEDTDKKGLYYLTALPVSEENWERVKGDQGLDGKSGVYVGDDEPSSEEEANVWISPNGISAQAVLSYLGTEDPDLSIGSKGDFYGKEKDGIFSIYFRAESGWKKIN